MARNGTKTVEKKELTEDEKRDQEILRQLARLGGEKAAVGDVQRGPSLVLPYDMPWSELTELSKKKEEEEEEFTVFSRQFNYRPWDVAHAAVIAMRKQFGTVLHGGSFWNPAAMRTVPSGVNETIQIPWGEFNVPTLGDCVIKFTSAGDPEHGLIGVVIVTGPNKYAKAIHGMFALIEKELKETSLYRGKVFDGATSPNFVNTKIDTSKIVFNAVTLRHLNAHIFGVLRGEQESLTKKRAVLLSGEFGTGKTLAMKMALAEAERSGWTGIVVRVAQDDISEAIRTAMMYAPSLVVVEDIDLLANAQLEAEAISKMLDVFDGAQAKGRDVMLVLSTNYKEKLPRGMLRPGRLDRIIELGLPDAEGIEKLIRANMHPDRLSDTINWREVADANDGFIPAFVVEAAESSVRYLAARVGGLDNLNGEKIETEDLVDAAEGLRPQYSDYKDATTDTAHYALDHQLHSLVKETIKETVDPDFLQG